MMDGGVGPRIRQPGLAKAGVVATMSVLGLTMCVPSGSGGVPKPPSPAPAPRVTVPASPHWPSSIAGRKILDQHGHVYLMRSFSSWSMAMNLTDAEITTALAGVAARGFNAVTVWAGGGYDLGEGWDRYNTEQHGSWWKGTPWASDLGPGWAAMDRVMSEARRLGLTVNFSFCGGFGTTGARPDWDAATDQQMHAVGAAVARRYAAYPNIVWHVMFDDGVSSTTASRINALFDGINDTEGASKRPVRWGEPNNKNSIYGQLIKPGGMPNVAFTLNGFYDNWLSGSDGPNAVELVEASWNEAGATTRPTGDSESAYDASPYIDEGNAGQQLRERSYAVFIEGGSYINYSHEDWWPFGAAGWVSSTEGLEWTGVRDHGHTVQAQYGWTLLDQYVANRTWRPDNGSFLKTGTGSGDTKAAAGASDRAALAYFPSSRNVQVDTTIVGSARVRLRWYDPTDGKFDVISTSEAANHSRAVSYPSAHADGSNDWVLVVDQAI